MSTCLIIFALLLSFFSPCILSQQSYYTKQTTEDCTVRHPENAGYVCDAATPSCDTVAYFRVQAGEYATLSDISTRLFNTSSAAIASASGLSSPNASVSIGQGLYIPLTCTCYGNHSSQNVSYTILPGDTFYKLANQTYEGLTTCQAIQDENPTLIVTNLQIGQVVTMPIRCACPSTAQKNRGITSLVTYPVADGDDINSVVDMFGITQQEFLAANNISNSSAPLFAATTVLLPFLVKPLNPPDVTSSSSPPLSQPTTTSSSSSSNSSKIGIYIGVPVAVVALLLITAVIVFFLRTKKKGALLPMSPPKPKPPSPPKMHRDLHESMFEVASSEKLATFTLEEIKQATQNFSPSTLIKGAVYRGIMKGRIVAVKNVTRNVSKELQILSKVHHSNLVTLLGSCIASSDQSYLVYEYAENGSLNDCLHDSDLRTNSSSMSTLGWNTRLQVALDVATALEYIHDHANPSYVHKDVKSSNILLDSKYRGKLANFALAKSTTDVAITRHIVGTQGYMAPEYLAQGVVSPKIDVFAFGVVLLEILSGEEAVLRDRQGREMFLSSAISDVLSGSSDGKESLKAWMDLRFQNMYPLDCAYSVALLARSCVADDPSARPHIRDVAYTLAKVLEISLEWEPSAVLETYNSNSHLEAR